ncbi:hypothetical protein M758_UG253600 [Ceratodon purpureus]|nr:hypothetical protein M758_UG253600 [Ceratodon purpureus]
MVALLHAESIAITKVVHKTEETSDVERVTLERVAEPAVTSAAQSARQGGVKNRGESKTKLENSVEIRRGCGRATVILQNRGRTEEKSWGIYMERRAIPREVNANSTPKLLISIEGESSSATTEVTSASTEATPTAAKITSVASKPTLTVA